jgi:hypothetical protein
MLCCVVVCYVCLIGEIGKMGLYEKCHLIWDIIVSVSYVWYFGLVLGLVES